MSYRCRICGGTWTEIPPGAVEITATRRGARRGRLYKFGSAIHDLRLVTKPEPLVVQTELLQEVIQAPVPEIEDELAAITALAMAFRRSKKNPR